MLTYLGRNLGTEQPALMTKKPWKSSGYGDGDYIAVFDRLLIPIAKAYNPDLILVSAGFDAAKGDPLGQYFVTPYGYYIMIQKLMELHGRIVLALEGGYNLVAIADSAFACLKMLFKENFPSSEIRLPLSSALKTIEEVHQVLARYWPILDAAEKSEQSKEALPSESAYKEEMSKKDEEYRKLQQVLASKDVALQNKEDAYKEVLFANKQLRKQNKLLQQQINNKDKIFDGLRKIITIEFATALTTYQAETSQRIRRPCSAGEHTTPQTIADDQVRRSMNIDAILTKMHKKHHDQSEKVIT